MSDLKLYGTGRRKRSVARVFLKTGKGEILINGKHFKNYHIKQILNNKFYIGVISWKGEEKGTLKP